MVGRRREISFSVFDKGRTKARTPTAIAKILTAAFAEHATGKKVSKFRQLFNPTKLRNINAKVSLSALFGNEAQGTATLLPDIGRIQAGGTTDLRVVLGGVRETRKILESPRRMSVILARAFSATITRELARRWFRTGGTADLGKQTVSRGGSAGAKGGGVQPQGEADGGGAERRMQDASFIIQRTKEFKQGAKIIEDMLINPNRLIVQGKFVGIPSLRDFINVKVESADSPFNSIFLMLEFGTGRFAKPTSFVRRKGRFKVPSYIASIEPGVDTADWFNIGRARAAASAAARKKSPESNFPFRLFAIPGRRGRHIIFQERGIARSLAKARRAALILVVDIINQETQFKFPGWGAVTLRDIKIPTSVSVSLKL